MGELCEPFIYMNNNYDLICNFENLYKAHKKARLGKRNKREVIEFEMNLSKNLIDLSNSLKDETYNISGYYDFWVYEFINRGIYISK